MPPAPWHIGTPPTAAPKRFMRPVDIATRLSVTGCRGNSRLFSCVTAITALPRVSGSWGRASNTKPMRNWFQAMAAARMRQAHRDRGLRDVRQHMRELERADDQRRRPAARTSPAGCGYASAAGCRQQRQRRSARCRASWRIPCSMKPKPRPSTMPCTTVGGTQLAARLSSPLRPSSSQTRPVARAAL